MKALHTLLILGASTFFTACTDLQGGDKLAAPPPNTSLVPALPPRTVAIGLPGEAEQLQASFEKLKQKLAKDPNDTKTWLKLCEVFITEARITGNYGPNHDAALVILDRVLSLTTKKEPAVMELRSEALTLKAVIRLSQHNFSEALALGEEAVVLDPHRAFNYGVLVDANVELGHYAKAVEMSDKMVSTRPDLRSYSRVSYLREIYGNVEGAIDAMDMAVKAGYPGSEETSWCRVQLGGLHERNGDIASAEKQYRQALAERPDYPFALAALGRVTGKMKNYTEAEKYLGSAIALMPDAAFYQELARVYAAQSKTELYDEAVLNAGRALAGLAKGGEGHNHQVGLEMARYQLEFAKDLDNALINAEHEATHRADNNDVNLALAAIHYAKGDAPTAAGFIARAKSTGSKDTYMLCLEGLILAKNGEVAKGKALVAESLKRDPYQNHPFVQEARRMIGS
ncbi:MAG: tetratricopeptide repeat protein [Flavobacteriales bacterium]